MDEERKETKKRGCQTQVPWTKERVDSFIEMAMLNDDEAFIMRSRVLKVPVSTQATYLSLSESRVHQIVSELKIKYDNLQREVNDPQKFPPRRFSKEEVWMDTH